MRYYDEIPIYPEDDIDLPVETIGECKKSHRCKQYHVILADGYCINCWDKGCDNMSEARKEAKGGKRTRVSIARELNVSETQLRYMVRGQRPWGKGLKKKYEAITH